MKKAYESPELSEVTIDAEISMVVMSFDPGGGDKPHHKPGCPCKHCRESNHSPFDNDSPFGGFSPFDN